MRDIVCAGKMLINGGVRDIVCAGGVLDPGNQRVRCAISSARGGAGLLKKRVGVRYRLRG